MKVIENRGWDKWRTEKTSVDIGHEFGYCLYIAISSGDVGSTSEVFLKLSQNALVNRVNKL